MLYPFNAINEGVFCELGKIIKIKRFLQIHLTLIVLDMIAICQKSCKNILQSLSYLRGTFIPLYYYVNPGAQSVTIMCHILSAFTATFQINQKLNSVSYSPEK